jgi:adenylate kinase family enzyme
MAGLLGCPHVELDAIFHLPNWGELDDDAFQQQARQAVAGPTWVVDGNYKIVQDIVWGRADTVIWFDLPFAVVMLRVLRRTLRRTLLRTELWNGNREPFSNLVSLDPQKSIIAWTAKMHGAYRKRYSAAELDPRWSALHFVRLGSDRAVRQFLASLPTGVGQGGAS